ncbi:MAG: hypothetical protein GW809_01255 [Bacteroidetes bacterium]|nr:hypothetical protein [Bacteroidota bacterium]
MKKKSQLLKKGAITAFNLKGAELEHRNVNNIQASWHNVGVYFKRGMNTTSEINNLPKRFKKDDLEYTY